MSATVGLALATLAFVGTHLLLSHPLRDFLVARLRYRGFLGLYSLVALATLAWMIVTWRAAESSPLWVAPLWWWPFASAIMLFASILLVTIPPLIMFIFFNRKIVEGMAAGSVKG